jgi:prepilin-type N-terminal cleavage/methylation domain-containing protein
MKPSSQNGFTLVELAIVLMIVGLLLGGMLVSLSAQVDQRNISETQRSLSEIKEAIIGYALAKGRLPCPASSGTFGVEDPLGGGTCTHPNDGFVPAATLGITSAVDSQGVTGFAIDAWGNRIHYAVTQSNTKAFTTTNGMSSTGMSALGPDLLVCSVASTSGTSCSVANSYLTATPGVPVVIYSTGKNGLSGGASGDEAENPNPNSADNDRVFVSHNPTPTFDDLVVWISPSILYNRMVAAGKLP